MPGRHRQGGQHGEGFEPRRVGRVRGRVGVEVVAHEDEVEEAAFGEPPDRLDGADVLERVNGAGEPPAGRVTARAEQEEAEVHLAGGVRHLRSPSIPER